MIRARGAGGSSRYSTVWRCSPLRTVIWCDSRTPTPGRASTPSVSWGCRTVLWLWSASRSRSAGREVAHAIADLVIDRLAHIVDVDALGVAERRVVLDLHRFSV